MVDFERKDLGEGKVQPPDRQCFGESVQPPKSLSVETVSQVFVGTLEKRFVSPKGIGLQSDAADVRCESHLRGGVLDPEPRKV